MIVWAARLPTPGMVLGVLQGHAHEQGVVVPEAASQRLAQLGDLVAQHALGHLRELLGVAFAGDERLEHQATRDAEDVGGDDIQLDAGVFEGLLDPLELRGAGLGEPLAVAGQVPQLPDRLRRHEAAAPKAVLEQLRDPFGVEDVALAAREDPQMLGVDELLVETSVLQHVPHRLPVRARRFHRHLGHALGAEPVRHRLQVGAEGRERPSLLAAAFAAGAGCAHTGDYLRLADVDAGTPLDQQIHRRSLPRWDCNDNGVTRWPGRLG